MSEPLQGPVMHTKARSNICVACGREDDAYHLPALAPPPKSVSVDECACDGMLRRDRGQVLMAWTCEKHGVVTYDSRSLPEQRTVYASNGFTQPRYPRREGTSR